MPRRHARQLLLLSAALAATPVLAQTSDALSDVPATDTAALTRQLYETSAKPDQREQAAQRLLSRPDPAARATLLGALNEFKQPAVQIATVKALAATPTPDPSLINSLFALLDPYSDKALIDSAAAALSAYKNNPEVLSRLIGQINAQDERVRLAAIRSVGTFVEKKAAAALIPRIGPSEPSANVARAAADALAYLTGQDASTDWIAWWQPRRQQPDAEFQAELVRARAARFDAVNRRQNEVELELSRLLTETYQKTPRAQQTEVLLRYLRSSESSARAVGCKIALEAANADITPDPVKQQLRQLIGDSAPDVRRNAALALALINDAEAVVPLLTQLNQETDTTVRAALASALRPTRDPRAVPALMKLLDDPSAGTVQQVAEALGELGDRLRESTPALAEEAAEKLAKVLAARTRPQDNVDLRASLVAAMAPLKSSNRQVQGTLKNMLDSPGEDPKVRRAVLTALGRYKNPEFADSIANRTGASNDRETRLAALRALGESADNLGAFDRRLYDLIDPTKEPQVEIQDAAWRVLTILFTKAPVEQLIVWDPRLQDRPNKRLVVLKELRSRFIANGKAEDAAQKAGQIGDASREAKLYVDAIPAYTEAIAYAKANNKSVEIVSEGLLDAYLKNRQFAEGIKFTQQQINDNSGAEGPLGGVIRMEAERLVNEAKDYKAADELIDSALQMTPKLSPKYRDALQQLQAQVRNRDKQRNETPYPPDGQTQTAMAWYTSRAFGTASFRAASQDLFI